MASTFAFGFAEDSDEEELSGVLQGMKMETDDKEAYCEDEIQEGLGAAKVPVKQEDMESMLDTVPSRLAYTTSRFSSAAKRTPHLPALSASILRRTLWDVKLQLAAEDDDPCATQPSHSPAAARTPTGHEEVGLGKTDLAKDVYEGGFKAWEGAADLAAHLLRLEEEGRDSLWSGNEDGAGLHIVELGAGAALPSLILFTSLLLARRQGPNDSSSSPTAKRNTVSFTLADYNASVLRLLTLPNFVLAWGAVVTPHAFEVTHHTSSDTNDAVPGATTVPAVRERSDTAPYHAAEGDMHITAPSDRTYDDSDNTTESLSSTFTSSLVQQFGISLSFISGPWSPALSDLIEPPLRSSHPATSSPSSSAIGPSFNSSTTNEESRRRILILASETLYSPSSLQPFTRTLRTLLSRGTPGSAALVASKRVYFGVGGGVVEFEALAARAGLSVQEVWSSAEAGLNSAKANREDAGADSGVGRVVLRVTLLEERA